MPSTKAVWEALSSFLPRCLFPQHRLPFDFSVFSRPDLIFSRFYRRVFVKFALPFFLGLLFLGEFLLSLLKFEVQFFQWMTHLEEF